MYQVLQKRKNTRARMPAKAVVRADSRASKLMRGLRTPPPHAHVATVRAYEAAKTNTTRISPFRAQSWTMKSAYENKRSILKARLPCLSILLRDGRPFSAQLANRVAQAFQHDHSRSKHASEAGRDATRRDGTGRGGGRGRGVTKQKHRN